MSQNKLFTSTLKRGDAAAPDGMSLTLTAARAAAQEFSATMTKDKDARRRTKKRRQKRLQQQQELLAAAEAAAVASGVAFTGTMKRNVAKLHDGSEYDDEGFEADGDDETYDDDFENEASRDDSNNASSSGNPSKLASRSDERRKPQRNEHPLTDKMVAIQVGADANFEATLGMGKSKSSKQKAKKRDKDAFTDMYSRAGLPGKRTNDSDDDMLQSASVHSSSRPALLDEQLPVLANVQHTRAGSGALGGLSRVATLSPRSSPGTSNYMSDASTSQLPSIKRRAP